MEEVIRELKVKTDVGVIEIKISLKGENLSDVEVNKMISNILSEKTWQLI